MTETAETSLDYKDESGWHIMAACGHTVSGAVKEGDKITLCPNCQFLLRFKKIPILYPDRVSDEVSISIV